MAHGLSRVRIPLSPTPKNQPMLQFLDEIGAREPGDTPIVFSLDAAAAAELTYDPNQTESERHHSADGAQTSPVADHHLPAFGLDAERLTAIATDARSADQILARMSASERRRRPDMSTPYAAPRNGIEATLAELWAEALGLDRVGLHDDFFELGGSSLQATVLVNRLQQVLDRTFESIVVFDAPTPADLADLLERQPTARPRTAGPRLASRGERKGPLSFAQQRLWFLDQFNPDSTVYNERRAIRLRGSLRVDALEDALNELVARHESLRTTFPTTDGRAEQVVADPRADVLPIRDLSGLSSADREAETVRLVFEEVSRPFDLASGPLFRAGLVRLDDDEHVLWFVFHHIVADGWSVGVLLRDTAALYRRAPERRQPAAPDRRAVPRLHRLAARAAARRVAGAAGGLLAQAPGQPAHPRTSGRPPEAANPDLPRLERAGLDSRRAGGEVARRRAKPASHAVHDADGGLPCSAGSTQPTGRHRRGLPDREPQFTRTRRADRVLREHAGLESRPLGQPSVR